MHKMDRKDRMIHTLAQKLAHTEVLNAELLAIIQEMKEAETNGDNQTAPTERPNE